MYIMIVLVSRGGLARRAFRQWLVGRICDGFAGPVLKPSLLLVKTNIEKYNSHEYILKTKICMVFYLQIIVTTARIVSSACTPVV